MKARIYKKYWNQFVKETDELYNEGYRNIYIESYSTKRLTAKRARFLFGEMMKDQFIIHTYWGKPKFVPGGKYILTITPSDGSDILSVSRVGGKKNEQRY